MVSDIVEKVARKIASGIGDDFDHAFQNKSAWNEARGESGGRYRDINEPFQPDYMDAAKATITTLLKAMEEPSEGMKKVGGSTQIPSQDGCTPYYEYDLGELEASACYKAMLAKFREEEGL